MNLKYMDYIDAIASEGSLSQAAGKLGVSQPTLSNFLLNLEAEIGMPLFYRERKKLVPTPAGRILIDAAQKILLVRDQTLQTIYHLTHEATETITIGVTPLRGAVMAAQIFPRFSRRFPEIRLKMKEAYTAELQELVKKGLINCSLGTCYDSESPDLDYITVSREELLLGIPSFHPLASMAAEHTGSGFPGIRPEQLFDLPFVLMSPGSTVRTISDFIFTKAGFQPTVVFESNNNLVINNMIRSGAGAGFLPRSVITEDADDIAYFSLSPRYYLHPCICTAKNRHLSLAERYLAYLVMCQDADNPNYVRDFNDRAWEIYREFEEESS